MAARQTTISDAVILQLFTDGQQDSLSYIDRDDLLAALRSSGTSITKSNLTSALVYLIDKGYITERGASYRITGLGIDYARFLLTPSITQNTTPSGTNSSGWRNWGDHPIVVLAGFILTIIGIVIFLTGRETISDFFASPTSNVSETATPNEAAVSETSEVVSSSTQSPDQLITEYYQLINNKEFSKAWEKLSSNYIQKHNSSGYSEYEFYWARQGLVEIENIKPLEPVDDRALFYVEVRYPEVNDSSEFRFAVKYDQERKAWLLDQYCELTGQPRCPVLGIE